MTTVIQLNKYVILSTKIVTDVDSHYLANFPTHLSHLLLPLIPARMMSNDYVVRGNLDWPPTYFPRCYPQYLQKINQSVNGPIGTFKPYHLINRRNGEMCIPLG